MPNHPKSQLFTSFKGLNNTGSPENTDQNYLKKALNVDIDKTGNISKRKGYFQVLSAHVDTAWASEDGLRCYAVVQDQLVSLSNSYAFHILRDNIDTEEMSFEEVDGITYYTSTKYNGIIFNDVNYPWGLEQNRYAPTLSITTGGLPAGTYLVSYTHINSLGIESGTSISSVITVPTNSGISLDIPTNPNISILSANIYCSTPDGTILYYSGNKPLGSTYVISTISNLVNPLRTFNLDSPPFGHIVKYWKGRLYVASDNVLWYSEPFQYNHFKQDSNYIEFSERIRGIMPVEDGIWVAADSLYYMSGESPDNLKRSLKEHIKMVEGTDSKVSGSYIHMDNMPIGYKWLITSDLGIFILFNQGIAINLTSQNVELESADSGSSVFLRANGLNQYLSLLKTNQNPNNSVVGDLVETSVVRNGITIP